MGNLLGEIAPIDHESAFGHRFIPHRFGALSRIGLVAALVPLIGISGCDAFSGGLSKSKARELILQAETPKCRVEVYRSRDPNSLFFTYAAIGKDLSTFKEVPNPVGGFRTLDYAENGATLEVTYGKDYMSPLLSLCVYVPDAITILDMTIDKETGKSARVVFNETSRRTKAAQAALDRAPWFAPVLRQAKNDDANPNEQWVANFIKLDATGWQLVGN